jgi:glycosyltransferase involved in cell wall biosynthesis
MKITAIIPTLNEEVHIEDSIKSVDFADEIIVIDSFSLDSTVEIAKKYNVKVIQRVFDDFSSQKNFAIDLAKNDWIYILDADERVTPELKKEIISLLQKPMEKDAYWISRQSFFMGKKIRFSGWQDDAVIRLIHKKCRYNSVQVHEEIMTKNINIGRLKNKLEHYTYKNLDHFLAKIQRYSDWSAQDHFNKTPKVTFYHLYFKPFFRFIKHYIIQLGFLDGKVGFIISTIMAWGVFLRYVKIQEKQIFNNL